MPTADVPNARLRYDVSGRGDPTVLVHGSLVDRTTWDAVRPGLAQSLTVLVYDRRGHGESTGAPRTHPVRDDAGDLAALLESIDLYPVHVIAHSYGGAVALRLAADRPEMVRSLALHEPPFVGLLGDDPATAPEAERLLAGTRAIQALARAGKPEAAAHEIVNAFSSEQGAWERLRPEVQRALVRHVDRWTEELADPEATQPDRVLLTDLLIPVLLTTGERSPPFVQRVSRLLAARLHNALLRTLPGVGHAPHLSAPDQFIALVHSFLVERNVPTT
jgi:pimeloyl-ACP methyl ester carboxylesterase